MSLTYEANLSRLDRAYVERLHEERTNELKAQIRQILRVPSSTLKEQLAKLRVLIAKR
jgi:hypothetical protein